MQIYYSPENEGFMIEDLGVGMGTYLRIDQPLTLQTTQLFNLGASFLIVSLMDKQSGQNYPSLKAKVCGGPNNGKMWSLDPVLSRRYTLGRSEDCDLHITDSVLSQKHCLFEFTYPDENSSEPIWLLRDGNGNKKSLNGTWLYLNKPTKLDHKLTFKVSEILFEANVQ